MQTNVPSQSQLISNRLKHSTWSNRESNVVLGEEELRLKARIIDESIILMMHSFKLERERESK